MPRRRNPRPTSINYATDRTTKEFLIQQHYENIKEELTWDTNRLIRLCAACGVTLSELAAAIRFDPGQMGRCASVNQFPPTVELHLTMIERTVFRLTKPPLFPANIFK